MSTEQLQGTETESEIWVPSMLPREGRLPTDPKESEYALLYALSRLIAEHVNRLSHLIATLDPGPDDFRKELLDDQPACQVAPENVIAWISKQAERDGEASLWITIPVQPSEIKRQADGTGLIEMLRFPLIEDGKPVPSPRFLWYIAPDHGELSIKVAAHKKLDRLRCYAESLARQYPWAAAQAATFLLTGMVPVLNAGPLAPPLDAPTAGLQLKGRKAREMSVRTLELGVFNAQHRGEPLATRFEQWNSTFPEWKYGVPTGFSWAAQEAERRMWERMKAYIARGGRSADSRQSPGDPRFDTNP